MAGNPIIQLPAGTCGKASNKELTLYKESQTVKKHHTQWMK